MSDPLKIRTLLSDPREEHLTLQTVINDVILCSDTLRELEYKNSGHALSQAKQAIRKAKFTLIEFENRIKGEVSFEVTADIASRPPELRRRGNPDKIKDYPGGKKIVTE